MKSPAMILTAGMVVGAATLGHADTSADLNTQATIMNNVATSQGENKVVGKISSDFSSFLGSDANAVVSGLRSGTPIKLTSTTTTPSTTPGGLPVTTTTTTTITPPTGQMGFGNVYISLALAKQQLSTLGITQPTPQQLQAALTGGTITQTTGTGTTTTNLQGILTMRSQNMGWGKIAQQLNFKLGPVMSSMKSANHSLASTASASTSKNSVLGTAGQNNSSSGGAIVSASGKGVGNGMVSAAGSGSNGNAYGRSSGIVTGAGHGGGTGGGVSSAGGGNGAAHGNGHGK
ncbi:MAG TPA: hypothetical protein VNT76_02450 [Candidatus Binatus sp.]|nr:hypothetical protein [Candidatus Binatus sp.]